LDEKNVIGLISLTEDIEQELDTYLKLFILQYADDTVILAESSDDMQKQINYFYDFCMKWRLKVNIKKSKVLGFSSNGCLPNNIKLNYNDKELEILTHLFYLGIVFSKMGSFNMKKIKIKKNS
jgi:hypothetical protein